MPAELWLNFINENGVAKRVLVTGESFVIGRTPDNDLQIALGSLSRQHAKIERFADVYTISDCGSSNGSTLNGERLDSPLELRNGDRVILGDEVDIKIELVSNKSESPKSAAVDDFDDDEDDDDIGTSASAAASNSGGNNSLLIGCFILVPILGLLVLLIVGGIFLATKNTNQPEVVENRQNGGSKYKSNNDDDEPPSTPEKTETPTTNPNTSPTTTTNSPGGTSTPQPTDTVVTTPKPSDDTEKIEINSSGCLRRIAQNDPRAFLTSKQVSLLSSRINEFKGSSAIAENLRNASKNAEQIKKLADSRNLKPQFLMIAALTKLGNQKGDVAATAEGMLEGLSNISQPFGTEFADESLLVIAAYSSNTSGESLQNSVGSLTKKPGVSARTARSIWYFKDNGKLSEPQFNFALRFLAIGTIAQNPKDFGVQADSVVLN